MRDANLKWYFAESKNGGGKGVNDGLSDLFSGGGFQDLIRESIQNSLDAKAEGEPYVRVEYRLRSFPVADFPNLLGLKEHIEACNEKYPGSKFQQMLQCLESPTMQVLDIADFNTIGMDYDSETDSGRFSKFVRYSGDPNSDSGAGGSHGYGKITYFKISGIKTILVSSMNRDDLICTFQGASRLATHPTGVPKYTYNDTGFFDEGEGDPIQEAPIMQDGRFIFEKIPADFQRQEPGSTTSILFTAIDDSNKKKVFKECCEAVLRSFFVAIEAGTLEVSIDLGDGYELLINKASLEKIFTELFFKETIDNVKSKPFERLNPHPYWLTYKNNTEVTVAPGTPTKDAAQLCMGKQYVLIKEHLPILGDVAFYACVAPDGNDLVLFMRRPKMLVNLSQPNRQVRRGFSAIFICDDPNGNELLRKMENAAHDKWDVRQLENDSKTEAEIALAQDIDNEMVDFINNCLDNILFPSDDADSTSVELNDFPMPLIELDGVVNPYLGSLISIQGQEDNNTGAPVGLIVKDTKTRTPRVSFGQAHTITKRKAKKTKENTGTTTGASKKHHVEGGGSSTSGQEQYKDSEESAPILVRQEIKLRSFRTIHGNDASGKDEYTLIVHSPMDVEKAYLTLTPVGETADKEAGIELVSASAGKIKGNEIAGVPLNEGRNEFSFSINEAGEFTFSLKAEQEVPKK